mmetsp:Transcript_9242/g.8121  ORF Transcript_9242/g.8121 Transcript_9242/m.8121 type:complete len:186 (+) Transcript_9242:46-603(+)
MQGSSGPKYVLITPDQEIAFNYVPKKYLTSSMTLKNMTEKHVLFKIKTNQPACYLVKPHTGTISPQTEVQIAITMQPTEYNPQSATIKDKFLINAFPLPEEANIQNIPQDIWKNLPSNQIQNAKLKVALKYDGGMTQSTVTPATQQKEEVEEKQTRSTTLTTKKTLYEDAIDNAVNQPGGELTTS